MTEVKYKYVFCVQGEGRGHMTQAIALQNLLLKNGHEVLAVIVGKSERREIPSYFMKEIKCDVIPVLSPNFVTDKNNKSIKISKTIIYNLMKFPTYKKSVKRIKQIIENTQPDFVINFYEFLCGYYFGYYKSKAKHICIGHQYLLAHKSFQFPNETTRNDKFWYMVNTAITSQKASKKLALSFTKMEDDTKNNIFVVPPLLRSEVLALTPAKEDFILIYVVNAGFCDDIIHWHSYNKNIKIELFSDRNDISDGAIIDDTLIFHKLNDQKFLDYMKRCKAYSSTAGFESICEAMYLGKKVMLVPPKGHFEQKCNALDAVNAGAGIESSFFDLTNFIQYLSTAENQSNDIFKDWVSSAEDEILKHIA